MPNYNVQLYHGYAEDQSNAALWMNLRTRKKLTDKEVVEDLERVFLLLAKSIIKGEGGSGGNHGKGCKADVPEGANYCPGCGVLQEDEYEIEENLRHEAANQVAKLATEVSVEIPVETVEFFEENGWGIWGKPISGRLITVVALERGLLKENDCFPEIYGCTIKVSK